MPSPNKRFELRELSLKLKSGVFGGIAVVPRLYYQDSPEREQTGDQVGLISKVSRDLSLEVVAWTCTTHCLAYPGCGKACAYAFSKAVCRFVLL